ncbi:hypothetical protein BJ508DRAFT_379790, partial [Ascobolus immersus RN42]
MANTADSPFSRLKASIRKKISHAELREYSGTRDGRNSGDSASRSGSETSTEDLQKHHIDNAPISNNSGILGLPREIHFMIGNMLRVKDLAALGRTCKPLHLLYIQFQLSTTAARRILEDYDSPTREEITLFWYIPVACGIITGASSEQQGSIIETVAAAQSTARIGIEASAFKYATMFAICHPSVTIHGNSNTTMQELRLYYLSKLSATIPNDHKTRFIEQLSSYPDTMANEMCHYLVSTLLAHERIAELSFLVSNSFLVPRKIMAVQDFVGMTRESTCDSLREAPRFPLRVVWQRALDFAVDYNIPDALQFLLNIPEHAGELKKPGLLRIADNGMESIDLWVSPVYRAFDLAPELVESTPSLHSQISMEAKSALVNLVDRRKRIISLLLESGCDINCPADRPHRDPLFIWIERLIMRRWCEEYQHENDNNSDILARFHGMMIQAFLFDFGGTLEIYSSPSENGLIQVAENAGDQFRHQALLDNEELGDKEIPYSWTSGNTQWCVLHALCHPQLTITEAERETQLLLLELLLRKGADVDSRLYRVRESLNTSRGTTNQETQTQFFGTYGRTALEKVVLYIKNLFDEDEAMGHLHGWKHGFGLFEKLKLGKKHRRGEHGGSGSSHGAAIDVMGLEMKYSHSLKALEILVRYGARMDLKSGYEGEKEPVTILDIAENIGLPDVREEVLQVLNGGKAVGKCG